jgi:dTDP-4-amino-4,6-dideoxygalactose transaminase
LPSPVNVKSDPSELALFGGAPLFSEPIHVGRPNIGDRSQLLARINALLDRRWLSNKGPFVQEFELRVADLLGVRHCIAITNGTLALEIAIRALGLTGEVLVPSFTFIATAHALQWQGTTPVFCDIDSRTHALDVNRLEQMITPRTTGIIGVHVWGEPCAIEELTEIARRRNLKLMFDASHAFGCSHTGQMIGNFGIAEVFSFHATKYFNTFEGGAITTNDDALAAKIRLMKNFGFAGYDNVIYIGTNGKMSEVAAAMGLTGLESLEQFIAAIRLNYVRYRKCLEDITGLRVFPVREDVKRNYQYVVVEIDEERTGISRDLLVRLLHAENILARRYFYPGCHRMEPYRSYFPNAGLLLPETEALCNRVIVLPNDTTLKIEQVEMIGSLIRMVVENGPTITQRAG